MTKILIAILYGLILLTPQLSLADNSSRPELSGEFELEMDGATEDPYSAGQRKSFELFTALKNATKSLTETSAAELPSVDDNAILFLNAVYLYCSTQKGTCKMVLDAILEADVVNAKLKGTTDCPILTKFWKSWVKNEMERREEFTISTGYMRQAQDFKRDVRPRYIRCQPTIEKEVAGSTDNLQYFKSRYATDSLQVKAVSETTELLRLIKEKMPNLYGTIGLSVNRAEGAASKGSTGKNPGKAKKVLRD